MQKKKNNIIIVDVNEAGDAQSSTVVKEHTTVDMPRKYNVIMHNDNDTPMGFVIEVLVGIFNKERKDAIELMLYIHHNGKGIAGTYTKSIAESKLMRTREIAEKEGFGEFKVTMEMA